MNWTENIIFYYHPVCEQHLEGIQHPENPRRLKLLVQYLKENGWWEKLRLTEPLPADEKWIALNHSPRYIDFIRKAVQRAPAVLDIGDTIVTEKSFEAAKLAAGAAIQGIDDLMNHKAEAVFCAIRPPGHHAEYNSALGFCLFNNIAIAARYAMEVYSIKKIFIFDWDVHHGNGTQHSFEESCEVFYCSIHQWPLFPGTGRATERGRGAGEGYNLNIPLPPGSSDEDYFQEIEEKILPAIRNFQPQLFLFSAGFDAHDGEPISSMKLSTQAFGKMTRMIKQEIQAFPGCKILSVLEGGYNIRNLYDSLLVHLEELGKI